MLLYVAVLFYTNMLICCGSILSVVQFLFTDMIKCRCRYFPLFMCMVMYDNELKTKENKN